MSQNRRTQSEKLYQEAVEMMPAGVNSPVRAFRSVGGTPIYMDRGEGAALFDMDGNRYLDFCGSWGPLILGHCHPMVQQAIMEVVQKGWTFGTPVAEEVALARMITQNLPGMEMVRFVNSGTEAVMSAIRVARGATGRSRVLKFGGCYHGHVDYLLVDAGSGLATFGTASSAGVPREFVQLTATLPLDDEVALARCFEEIGEELACVIVEPVPANNGLLLQRPAFLKNLREFCTQHGVLLIFDEVLSGFRMPEVMAYQHYQIKPDLVTLGKVIGGGMPVGAYGGRRDLMEHVAPLGNVYQAGTLSGNPVAMAAGHATLAYYFQHDVPGQIERLGQHLDMALKPVLAQSQSMGFQRLGSLFWFYFGTSSAPRRASAIPSDAGSRYAPLHKFMLDQGIYMAPSAYEVGFLNAAMTVEDLNQLVQAIDKAIRTGVVQ